MASLGTIISNWFRQKKEVVAKALGDDVRDGKFAIEDAKQANRVFESQIIALKAESAKIQNRITSRKEEIKKWQSIAEAAAKESNTAKGSDKSIKVNDAKTALMKKQTAENELKRLEDDLEKNRKVEGDLERQLNFQRSKISKAESDFASLSARKRGTEIRKQALEAQRASGLSDGTSPFAALDDLSKALEQDEAEITAMEEISGTAQNERLEQYIQEDTSDVEAELAALLKKNK